VDDSCSLTRALVDRISWSHRRWTYPSAARYCADCVGYQSGFGPKDYIAFSLFASPKYIRIDHRAAVLRGAFPGGRKQRAGLRSWF